MHTLTHTRALAHAHTSMRLLTHSYTHTTRGIPPPLQPLLAPPGSCLPSWGERTVSPSFLLWQQAIVVHNQTKGWKDIGVFFFSVESGGLTPGGIAATAAWEERLAAEFVLWSNEVVWGCSVTTDTGHLGAGCHGNRLHSVSVLAHCVSASQKGAGSRGQVHVCSQWDEESVCMRMCACAAWIVKPEYAPGCCVLSGFLFEKCQSPCFEITQGRKKGSWITWM